jgi:hypothetical protein
VFESSLWLIGVMGISYPGGLVNFRIGICGGTPDPTTQTYSLIIPGS